MTIESARLLIRPAVESDRARMLELWQDEHFQEFSNGVLSEQRANERFDRMLAELEERSFAKQPIIERSSATIIGYTGVDRFEFEGASHLEWGYRLVLEARGKGYATEAGLALLEHANEAISAPTEVFAIIDPRNAPSQNVARKLGFAWHRHALVNGYYDDLWLRTLG